MKGEKTVRILYEKMKKAEGEWSQVNETTSIKLSKDELAIKVLEWILDEREDIFEIDNFLGEQK